MQRSAQVLFCSAALALAGCTVHAHSEWRAGSGTSSGAGSSSGGQAPAPAAPPPASVAADSGAQGGGRHHGHRIGVVGNDATPAPSGGSAPSTAPATHGGVAVGRDSSGDTVAPSTGTAAPVPSTSTPAPSAGPFTHTGSHASHTPSGSTATAPVGGREGGAHASSGRPAQAGQSASGSQGAREPSSGGQSGVAGRGREPATGTAAADNVGCAPFTRTAKLGDLLRLRVRGAADTAVVRLGARELSVRSRAGQVWIAEIPKDAQAGALTVVDGSITLRCGALAIAQ